MQARSSTSLQALLGLGILYTLYIAHELVLPLVVAFMISLVLSPLVLKARRRWHLPKPLTAFCLLVLLVSLLGGLVASVATPALDWAEKAPEILSNLFLQDSQLHSQLNRLSRSAEQLEESVGALSGDQVQTVLLSTDSWRSQLADQVQEVVVGLVLAIILTYFFLVSGDHLIRNLARQLPTGRRHIFLGIVRSSQKQVAGFLGVFTLTNLGVGLITALICWAVGLPNPVFWGLIGGAARFIPYLGVTTALGLLSMVAATSLDALWAILLVPLAYLTLTALVGTFFEPYIHGFRMAVNPIVVFFSIFFWGWLWGPVGFFLAVPLMTVIQVVLSQIPALRPVYRVIAR
ncbi:AI-2E family transporter [Marinospirillum perlucidum]|uniref:AI-2E family transporter n=1 Tax=Marinospirillum perlucidum TaxID=1982602 RepID=UPI000DF41BB6|nr:AI-2E family transporter [Marinospirillum perlucidum]